MNLNRVIKLLIVEDDPAYLYVMQEGRLVARKKRDPLGTPAIATDGGTGALQILLEDGNSSSRLPVHYSVLIWNLPKITGLEVFNGAKATC